MEVGLQALRSLSSGLLGLPRASFLLHKIKIPLQSTKGSHNITEGTVAKTTPFLVCFYVFLTNLYKNVLER